MMPVLMLARPLTDSPHITLNAMANSFTLGERFHEKVKEILESECSSSPDLLEELEALKGQTIISFKTARKLQTLLQQNGRKTIGSVGNKGCSIHMQTISTPSHIQTKRCTFSLVDSCICSCLLLMTSDAFTH